MTDTYTRFYGLLHFLFVFDNSFTNLACPQVALAYLGQSYPLIIIIINNDKYNNNDNDDDE